MAETIQLNEFIKLSNLGPDAVAMADRERSMVYVWDCGPTAPSAPRRPVAPKGKEGDPEFDLAMVDFRQALVDYEADLKTYGARKEEFAHWQRQNGGPIELKMWSVDARDAFARDGKAVDEGRQPAKRYFISSRTRGHESLPNQGLPGNLKPGKGHLENLRREREGDADLDAARRADPIFGAMERRA
ncbi:MAG: hypothetical protein ABR863_12800 [Roseiarcus sp.]